MADSFSSFTDSDDEKAVEHILSQALDHSVLEQIAAINSSSFSTSSDNLPFDLENRFRKLKSLPTTTAATTATTAATGSLCPPSKSKSFTPRSVSDSNLNERIPDPKKRSEKSPPLTDDDPKQLSDANQDENNNKTNSKPKPKPKPKPKQKLNSNSLKLKSRTGSWESRSDLWNLSSPESESESRSVSPVRRGIGCLWCSPKKEKRKQGKENLVTSPSSWGNEYDVEFLKTFSMKERKKIMKKAMKEEERINREAEKIVKWAKQASDRMMDVSGVVDDDDADQLSDLDK